MPLFPRRAIQQHARGLHLPASVADDSAESDQQPNTPNRESAGLSAFLKRWECSLVFFVLTAGLAPYLFDAVGKAPPRLSLEVIAIGVLALSICVAVWTCRRGMRSAHHVSLAVAAAALIPLLQSLAEAGGVNLSLHSKFALPAAAATIVGVIFRSQPLIAAAMLASALATLCLLVTWRFEEHALFAAPVWCMLIVTVLLVALSSHWDKAFVGALVAAVPASVVAVRALIESSGLGQASAMLLSAHFGMMTFGWLSCLDQSDWRVRAAMTAAFALGAGSVASLPVVQATMGNSATIATSIACGISCLSIAASSALGGWRDMPILVTTMAVITAVTQVDVLLVSDIARIAAPVALLIWAFQFGVRSQNASLVNLTILGSAVWLPFALTPADISYMAILALVLTVPSAIVVMILWGSRIRPAEAA